MESLNFSFSNEKVCPMKLVKILLVDDEDAVLMAYQRYFNKKGGYSTEYAKSIKEMNNMLLNEHFDAMLLDVNLPDGNSIDHLKKIREKHDNLAIIMVTAQNDTDTAVSAIRNGADNFITKPVNMDTLFNSIEKALEIELIKKKERFQNEVAKIKQETTYFGESIEMQQVIHCANVASINDTVVFINGETGTGKGVLARWIHFNSNSQRKNNPFIELNCSSLKGDMLKSELFGHARGSFTSAHRDRAGLVEVADGGTLFLDEIGDMDLDVQAQLLKVIEEKSYRRLGENKIRKSDFRLICATNVDLDKAVKEGKFRSDLYYRICVFPIKLPALRDRKDDIGELINHILKEYSYPSKLTPDIYQALKEYSFPGNIRELKNMIERAILLSQGTTITIDHFPGLGLYTNVQIKNEPVIINNDKDFNLENVEKNYISKALETFKKDKTRAALALGISLTSLYRKMEKYRLSLK